ncbi:fibronectin isoform X2 [Ixodes scapularis]
MAGATRKTLRLICVLVLVAFGDARLRDRKSRQTAPGEEVKDTPEAPDVTGLKLEVLGNSSIEVRWNTPEVPVSRFEIVACPVVAGHPCVDATAKDKSSYTIENLKPGTEYEVTVQSVIQKRRFTSYGVPAKSRATTDIWVPPVTKLELSCPADGVIVAEWTLKESLLVDAIVIIACPPAEYDCRKATVGSRDPSVEIKGLLADEEYTVNVTTFITVEDTTYHGESVFANITTRPKPPSEVVNLMYEISNITRLNASWDEPVNQVSGVSGYFLSCQKESSRETITKKLPAGSQHVTTQLNLKEPLSKFTCRVWAYVEYKGTAINGTSTKFHVQTESPGPSGVRNFRFNVMNVTTLIMSWDRPTEAPWGISGYYLLCYSEDTNRTVNVTFADEEEHVIEHVDLHDQLARFDCSVTAYVQVGGKSYSTNETNFDVKTGVTVSSVTNLALSCPADGVIVAEWTLEDPSSVDTIVIIACPPANNDCRKATVGSHDTSVEIKGLLADEEYTVNVTTFFTVEETTYHGESVFANVTTRPDPPSKVVNLMHEISNVTRLNASWEEPANQMRAVNGYFLSCEKTGGHEKITKEVPPRSQRVTTQLNLKEPLREFTCHVWAYVMYNGTKINGTSTKFLVETESPAPSEVVNLMYEISNITRLNASWDEPVNQASAVNGYFLSCQKESSRETITKKLRARSQHVTTQLNLKEPLSKFTCHVWAYVEYKGTAINGTSTKFHVQTESPGPSGVRNFRFNVMNVTTLIMSWDRPTEAPWGISGYYLLCYSEDTNRTVNVTFADEEEHVIEHVDLHDQLARFDCSVTAYVQVGGKSYSTNETNFDVKTGVTVSSVTNLALSCPADGVIVAEWTLEDSSSVDTIVIIACPPANNDCRKATVGSHDTSVEIKGLLADEEYTVNVTTFFTVEETTYHGESVFANVTTRPESPSKVVNLMHEISNVTRLNASWEEPANQMRAVDGYFLSCEKSGGHENITKEVPARSQRVTTQLNLKEPLREFTCHVWAYVVYNGTEINGTSTKFSVETESPAPSGVRNVRFEVLNVTTLNVSWDRPTEAPWGISSYVVHCKSADTNRTVNVTFVDEEEYVIKLVDLHEQLTRFGCSVFAYVQVGVKTYTGNETNFDVKTGGIEAPKNVELVNRTATSFTFEWDADPKAPNYTIDVRTQDQVDVFDSWTDSVREERNGTVVHNVTGLKPWTRYKVSIRNCAEYCGKEAVLEQQTRVAAPSAVRNLKPALDGYTNVTLSWTKPANPNGPIDGYTVKLVDTERNQTFVHDLNTTSVTLNVVYKFTDFMATVAPYNLDDNTTLHGPSSSVAFSSSGDGPVPPRPHVEDVKDHSVLLTWETPKDKNHTIVGYEVTVNPGGKNISTNSTNVTLTDLEAWTQYSVLVASCTNIKQCGTPKAATFRTDVDAPSAPQNLTVHSVGIHWVDVTWKAPQHPNGPLSGYNVTLKNGSELVWATTRNTSHNITGLEPSTSYEISVYAYNKADKGEKKGPVASFSAQTQSEASGGGGVSGGTIAAAVLIPLLIIVLVVGFFVYRKYRRNRGESQSLLSGEGS